MPLCKLCLEREANQTGSHIFSWFLIRDAINKKERRRRHNEISFEISSSSFVQSFFGSEILPEDIESIKGRELTDEEIEKQENPYTRDHILCTICEKKLSILESYISEKVFDNLRKLQLDPTKELDSIEIPHKETMRLFVYSLIWRASITNFNFFRLEYPQEESLRVILNETLDTGEKALIEKANGNSAKICQYPLAIAFLETRGNNTNSIYCDKSRKPYAMIINDLAFQMFFKQKEVKRDPEYFFGINQLVSPKKALNCNEDIFKIFIIGDANRQKIYIRLYELIASKVMNRAVSLFRSGFKHIFRKSAPPGIVYYFRVRATHTKKDNIELYSIEHFRTIAADVMKEYIIMRQQT